jgi:tetratricopeptide (TPR) repeat protein
MGRRTVAVCNNYPVLHKSRVASGSSYCVQRLDDLDIMGSSKYLPLLTTPASTPLTVWFGAQTEQPLPQKVAQGWQSFDQGDITAAIACFQEILGRSQAICDAYFTHVARNSLHFIAQALGNWEVDLAEAVATHNLDLPQSYVDSTPTGYEHLSAAEVDLQNEQFEAALVRLEQALQVFTTQGDITGVGQSLSAIATVYLARADYGRALTYGQAAIAVLEDCNAPSNLAQALYTLGCAKFHTGHLDAAQTHLEQAACLFHQLEDTSAEGNSLKLLGQVYAQQNTFMFALAAYEAALDCCLEETEKTTEALTAEVLSYIGELYETMGYDEFAIAPYCDALTTYQQAGDTTKAQQLLQRLGHLYETQGRYTVALDCYGQLKHISR